MSVRVLVIDDDPAVQDLARAYLARLGFAVDAAMDGRTGVALAAALDPAVIVIDQGLPDVSGDAVLEEIRRRSSVPIVMISGSATTEDRVQGLNGGADDYLTKPFSPRELAARVTAVLRRCDRDRTSARLLSFGAGQLVIDMERHEVRVRGRACALTMSEYELLLALARRPGRVLTRAELAAEAGQHNVSARTVDSHIGNLRRKIEDVPTSPRTVSTVRGVGYRLDLVAD
jgi:DNA-binding response OmpR family regulator